MSMFLNKIIGLTGIADWLESAVFTSGFNLLLFLDLTPIASAWKSPGKQAVSQAFRPLCIKKDADVSYSVFRTCSFSAFSKRFFFRLATGSEL